MRPRRRAGALFVVAALVGGILAASPAHALDEERDGPLVTRAVFTGNVGIATADAGLYPDVESGTASVTIPASATGVRAAYLYWAGRIRDSFGPAPDSGDDTVDISIDGGAASTITATDTFYADAAQTFIHYNYWYDLTGSIGLGTSTVALSEFDLQVDVDAGNRHYGFGLVVIYDDPTLPATTIDFRDGNDRGYWEWSPPAGPDSAVHCLDIDDPADQAIDVITTITGVDSNEGIVRPQTYWWLAGSGTKPSGDDADASGIKAGTAVVNPVFPGPTNSDPFGFEFVEFTATATAADTWVCIQLESPDGAGQVGATTGIGAMAFSVPTGEEPDPTYSVGNQVWFDADGDGLRGDTEAPISGVVVQLLDDAGVLIAETTTDADGLYLFTGLDAGDYTVKIADSNFEAGGPLEDLLPTPIQQADPDTDIDNDSNGVVIDDMVMSGTVTLGDGEPTGEDPSNDEGTPDGDSNLTVDFGFVAGDEPADLVSLGNLVWWDVDDDGLVDDGEPVFTGITVNLWSVDDAGGPAALVQTTTTDSEGQYAFQVASDTEYIVQIPADQLAAGGPLAGFGSSTPTFDPGDGTDNDDNGDDAGDLGIVTAPVAVSVGAAPTGEADADPFGTDDASSDLTIDLGLSTEAGIGDYVWFDSGTERNVQDEGDVPIEGVIVRLYQSPTLTENDPGAVLIAETVTDANGFYFFGVDPFLNYFIEFEWMKEMPLDVDPEIYDPNEALIIVQPDASNGDEAIDSDGRIPHPAGISTIIRTFPTLISPGEFDLTWDLGLIKPRIEVSATISIGNLVWHDRDDDGIVDPGEEPFPGITVNLWEADADGNPTTLVTSTVTDENGHYAFVIPDVTGTINYVVQIPQLMFNAGGPLEGYRSSKVTFDVSSGSDNDDNGREVAGLGILSAPFTVFEGTAPTGETDADVFGFDDANSDLTIDFGLLQVCTTDEEALPCTGFDFDSQEAGPAAGYGLMLLGLGGLAVMKANEVIRRRPSIV